jgi:hypothetical protein
MAGEYRQTLAVNATESGGFHPVGANQSQNDLFSASGTLILERLATAGPSFLASPRNEAKRQQ